jgi:hypothetical protein
VADLTNLSPRALKAAAEGGSAGWGTHGSSIEHVRYFEPIRSRRKCHCGCGHRKTHVGMANGVALTSGCEMYVRRWVKAGTTTTSKETADARDDRAQ